MKKIGLLSLALVLALGALGVGYAAWTDTITISGTVSTGSVEWEFLNPPVTSGGDYQEPEVSQYDNGLDPDNAYPVDNVDPKDVAQTLWEFIDTDNDGDYDSLKITINNAYPYYYNHLDFWVHYKGNTPGRYEKVEFVVGDTVMQTLTATGDVSLDLGGTSEADIYIFWGDSFGTQLHYSDFLNLSFAITVLQPAPQNSELSFTIRLIAVQWND